MGSLSSKDILSLDIPNSNDEPINNEHLKYLPKSECDLNLEYTYYQICYSETHRMAKWAIHELNILQSKGVENRTNDFRADLRLKNPVHSSDYKNSGFDRGHLVPAADMRLNKTSMSESFYMTNMTPQNPGFNSGIWNSLEAFIRKQIEPYGPAIVITAPVLLEHESYLMIPSNVTIPKEFYKIIYFYESQIMMAYLIPNQHAQGKSIQNFKTTVRAIENLTDIDFFSELPNPLEEILETQL